ncbi:MAG TPA: dTDP-4-dehydrorhamnose 3,5-epimerase family protein [Methylomirabilota bacterium]|nr:dTDP-4-dehydrorhamnose 3,5-epimerase family protein [Methylomirabilota bacterium]
MQAIPPEVEGLDVLVPKQSAVDHQGRLRHRPIEGLRFRTSRPVPHEDGTLTEIARTDWPEVDQPIVQTHVTTTLPGRTRAWGLHRRSTDRLFVVRGLVSIVVYDGRLSSPTRGLVNEFKLSERNPGLLVIPPDLYHGWKVIGPDEAFIVNMPTCAYDHASPDALDLPYESPLAARIVPWRW